MTNKELVSALRTASEAAKMTNNPTWSMLMSEAADELERLMRENAKSVLHREWGGE